MDLALADKVALVTGSSRGIGLAIARTLRDEGCKVILNGRDPRLLAQVGEQLGVPGVAGDVTVEQGAHEVIEGAAAVHGRLDLLVCNVGSGASVPPGQESADEWQRMLGLNLLAATQSVAAARKHLARSQGTVLCVSSICGLAALGAPIAYSAAKAALNSYVRGSARHLAREGIRINALAPGNILFEGSTWERKLREDPTRVADMLEREVALRRLGSADEVAAMAAFLCSPRAGFATGGIFVLDGGQLRA